MTKNLNIRNHAYAFGYLSSAIRGMSFKFLREGLITPDNLVKVSRLIEQEIIETYDAESKFEVVPNKLS